MFLKKPTAFEFDKYFNNNIIISSRRQTAGFRFVEVCTFNIGWHFFFFFICYYFSGSLAASPLTYGA